MMWVFLNHCGIFSFSEINDPMYPPLLFFAFFFAFTALRRCAHMPLRDIRVDDSRLVCIELLSINTAITGWVRFGRISQQVNFLTHPSPRAVEFIQASVRPAEFDEYR